MNQNQKTRSSILRLTFAEMLKEQEPLCKMEFHFLLERTLCQERRGIGSQPASLYQGETIPPSPRAVCGLNPHPVTTTVAASLSLGNAPRCY
ncbi:unnamed protein product [Nezara viridula]|uniref:Uncharacterized protein n=1 Tax=Nezara viridula TaxID=85310 RepID=A0A9P0H4E1_NEZVI|nr:unnamed protein product [Nezara viridula]